VLVASDGINSYWIGSALTLNDGNILVSYSVNGPESGLGVYSGFIAVKLSTNNGATWGAQVRTSQTCNAEFPRAIENTYGSIVQFYSRYVDVSDNHLPLGDNDCADFISPQGYPETDIHQIWSSDDGATWTGDATTYHNPNGFSSIHPAINIESYQPNSAACPSCKWDLSFVTGIAGTGNYGVFQIYSYDQWASWNAPTQYPGTMVWSNFLNIDPSVTLGCTGALVSYTDAYEGQNLYNLRYVASSTCNAS
jgi:hypothetical protein